MNKTVNINLAGIFFHIDEDAYLKLQRYLEAIKRSFTDSQGRSEIIADIEARISELFNERVQNDKQVIRIKEVDEVITIMGQPEDYLVDDEIFEDEPTPQYRSKPSSSKKLFRDTDNSYIGGVASGLAHYLGIESIWVRLLWLLLALGSGGTFILIYVLFWILVPEAVTTSEKLTMTGEPVNISNIEKKIKDGFDSVTQTVSDTVKNVDLPKHGNKIKSSSKSFFDTIGDVIMFFLKVFAKFIGVILIIVGASTLIALFISMFSLGTSSFFSPWWMDYVYAANTSGSPIWLVALTTFFAVGVPFFVVFLVGLKILVNNLKSIGKVAKFTLLGLWLISILSLAVMAIQEASEMGIDETVSQKTALNITSNDTLSVTMVSNDMFSNRRYRSNDFKIVHDENDNKKIYSTDIRLIFRSTKDSVASIIMNKNAGGKSYQDARKRASNIEYSYSLDNNILSFDNYLLTGFENHFRDQEVELTVYLPEGTVLYADDNTYYYHRNTRAYRDILDNGMEEHYLKITTNGVECLDCDDDDYELKIDLNDDTSKFKLDEDGLEIKSDDSSLKIDEDGLKATTDDVKVNIDEDGIEISSDDN